jgi:hypothetical protein
MAKPNTSQIDRQPMYLSLTRRFVRVRSLFFLPTEPRTTTLQP